MSTITLQVLTSPSCVRCEEFVVFWESISGDWQHVDFREVSVLTLEGQELALRHRVFASPGVLLNDQLIFSGSFEKEHFLAQLKALSSL